MPRYRLAQLDDFAGQAFTAKTFNLDRIPRRFFDTMASILRLAQRPTTEKRPVLPVLVSDRIGSPLTLTLDVTQVGSPITAPLDTSSTDSSAKVQSLLDRAAELAGPGTTPAGQTTTDLTGQLRRSCRHLSLCSGRDPRPRGPWHASIGNEVVRAAC